MQFPNLKFHGIKDNATVGDTIGLIITYARKFHNQKAVDQAIRHLGDPHSINFLRNLFNYVDRNVRYLKDPPGDEYVATPDYVMKMHQGDCKKMATFFGAVLTKLGIKHYYKVISYDAIGYEHIYVIVPSRSGSYTVLDPVADHRFNNEIPHAKELVFDLNGNIVRLHAIGNGPNPAQSYPPFYGGFNVPTTPFNPYNNPYTIYGNNQVESANDWPDPLTAWQDSYFPGRIDSTYFPGYGAFGAVGSMGATPCGDFSDSQEDCEGASDETGPINCNWYGAAYDPPCDAFGKEVTPIELQRQLAPVTPPRPSRPPYYAAYTPRREFQMKRRVPRGLSISNGQLDSDLNDLSGIFKMGGSDLKKLGSIAGYLILPLFIERYNWLMKAGNKPVLTIPGDLQAKINQIKTWVLGNTRAGFHETYLIYLMIGFTEGTGINPITAINNMYVTRDYQIGGEEEDGENSWAQIKKWAGEAWDFVKGIFERNISKDLENFPATARWTVPDWKRLFGVALGPGDVPGPLPTHTGTVAPIVYVAQRSPGSDEIFFRTQGYVPVTKGETFTIENAPGYSGVYVATDSVQTTASNVPGQKVYIKGTINLNSPTYKFLGDKHQDHIKAGTLTDGVTGAPPTIPTAKGAAAILPIGILAALLLS